MRSSCAERELVVKFRRRILAAGCTFGEGVGAARHTAAMGEPSIGSEAVASGRMTQYALRSRFATIYPDVYVARDTEVNAIIRAKAAWLWSRRRGVIAGCSASAVHGVRWVDHRAPAEILYENRHAPATIRTWSDRVEDDEVNLVAGMPVTTPAQRSIWHAGIPAAKRSHFSTHSRGRRG